MMHPIPSLSDLVLRLVLGLLAAYHVGIGIASVTSHGATAAVTRRLYATRLGDDPQFRYAVKMLGLYGLAFGGLLAAAAWSPSDHRATIVALIALQLSRALCRLRFAPVLSTGFGVSRGRNAGHATLLIAEAAALVWLFPTRVP